MIVGICGLSGSGKDAAGEFLVKNHGYVRVAFADVMKRVCMEVFDFTEEQLWGDGKNEPDERYKRRVGEDACVYSAVDAAEGKLKEYFEEEDGWYKALTPRAALQKLGSWGRECYPDVWAEKALRDANTVLDKCTDYNRVVGPVHAFSRDYNGVVITDVRFKNEVKAIKKAGGWVARIKRPGHDKPKWDHPSETEQLTIPDVDFNFIIDNGEGLSFLERQMKILVEVLK